MPPIGIFHTTTEGHLIDVNPVFARMFGYSSPAEMIVEVNKSTMAQAHYANPLQRTDIVNNALETGGWHTYDTPFRKTDGQLFHSLISIRAYVNPSGGMQELDGFVVDVTTSRQAEARITAIERRYHNLFDSAGDAMLVLDYDAGTILDANPSAVRMYGYTRDELKNMQHKDLFAEPETETVPVERSTLLQPGVLYRKKDGTVFAAEITESRYRLHSSE